VFLPHIRAKEFIPVAILAAFLSACGGGGGGSSTSSTNSSSFNTTEFQANYGLASINALTAYDNSGTGSGITVAVIDTGIDLTHSDLSGNTSANSASVGTISTSVQDTDGHGTAVAGIIAATQNSTGTHGVAFSSTLLAVKMSNDGTATNADAAAGFDYAIAQNAKVINYSFGASTFNSTLADAVQRAVDAGIIIVASSGNDGNSESDQIARLANCEGASNCTAFGSFDAKGLMIAVGATDSSNAIASFSNLAGDTDTAYLVAPGVSIVTTANGGGTQTINGTSFSAPHVSGAVALILQRFPSLTAAQAVTLLLSSATDLGATGTDTTFGRGLLNLQAAFSAQGVSSIPTSASVSGSSNPLIGTKLILGSAFGDALSGQSFLAEAIILDAYQRAYHVDLRDRIVSGTASLDAMSFLEADDVEVVEAPMPKGMSLRFDVTTADQDRLSDAEMGFAHHRQDNLTSDERIGALRFSAELSRQMRAQLAMRSTPLSLQSETLASGLFFNSGWTASPQLSMLGRGDSLSFSNELDQSTRVNIGFHRSKGAARSQSGRGYLGQASLRHAFDNGVRLGLGAGYVAEEAALFRSTSSGAFGQTADNQSQYYSISAIAPIDVGVALFAGYTEATARPSFTGDSLLGNWSRVRANAFSAGVAKQSTFAEGDRLGLSIGQPLRVHRSSADLTLPVARDLDGNVIQETRRVDLTPSGRQIDVQLAYQSPLGQSPSGTSYLRSFATLSLQPGHDREAEPETAIGIKWGMKF